MKDLPSRYGGYNDFNLNLPGSGETVAGICHARGPNVKLPPQGLVYITVSEVDESAKLCVEFSGKIFDGREAFGGDTRVCVT